MRVMFFEERKERRVFVSNGEGKVMPRVPVPKIRVGGVVIAGCV